VKCEVFGCWMKEKCSSKAQAFFNFALCGACSVERDNRNFEDQEINLEELKSFYFFYFFTLLGQLLV
jgi:hypothetical protein